MSFSLRRLNSSMFLDGVVTKSTSAKLEQGEGKLKHPAALAAPIPPQPPRGSSPPPVRPQHPQLLPGDVGALHQPQQLDAGVGHGQDLHACPHAALGTRMLPQLGWGVGGCHAPPPQPAPRPAPHRGGEEAGEIHLAAIPGCGDDLPLDALGGHGAEGVQLVFRCGEKHPVVSVPPPRGWIWTRG